MKLVRITETTADLELNKICRNVRLLQSEDLTIYKIAYTAVDEKPEVQLK